MDISQATKNVVFLTPLTCKGLEIDVVNRSEQKLPHTITDEYTWSRRLVIKKEGQVKKFVTTVSEVTFSGDMAVSQGQSVTYITERCVFKRTWEHPTLILTEIAPGINLEKDVLSHMEFKPVISKDLKLMRPEIYEAEGLRVMGLQQSLFHTNLKERLHYQTEGNTLFFNMAGLSLSTQEDIQELMSGLEKTLSPLTTKNGKLNAVVNYEHFDCHEHVLEEYIAAIARFEKSFYASVRRYSGRAFYRAKLSKQLQIRSSDDL